MRKIRFKEISPELDRITAPVTNGEARTSLGQEKFSGEYYFIEIDKLIPFKNQARRNFDEDELLSLADTIKEHGIRQPLTVIKSLDNHNAFEVVSGERRLRAAILVGLKTVPCIIIEGQDKAEEIALIENIQRQDLHPIELSRALTLLVEKLGHGGQQEVGKKVGLSKTQISEYVKISTLSENIQDYLLQHKVRGRELYRKVISLPNDQERMIYLKSTISNENIKGKALQKTVSSSVLRISLNNEKFTVQKKYLSKLNLDQKTILKNILVQLTAEIDGN